MEEYRLYDSQTTFSFLFLILAFQVSSVILMLVLYWSVMQFSCVVGIVQVEESLKVRTS